MRLPIWIIGLALFVGGTVHDPVEIWAVYGGGLAIGYAAFAPYPPPPPPPRAPDTDLRAAYPAQ